MFTTTKFLQALNLILFCLVLIAIYKLAGSVLGVMTTTLGVLVFLLPILIGLILTVIQIRKYRKQKIKMKGIEKFLAAFPIINAVMILLAIILSHT